MVKERAFADHVRDLGGDEEDIAFLEQVNVEGSDFEDTAEVADLNLTSDVDQMWQQLSRESTGKSTGKSGHKIVFDKPEISKEEPGTTEAAQAAEKAERDRAKRDKKRLQKAEKRQQAREGTGKETARAEKADSSSIAKEPKQTKRIKHDEKQTQLINEIRHPDGLVVDEDAWYNYNANSGSKKVAMELIDALKAKAKVLLELENKIYLSQKREARDYQASLEFLRSGTFSDQLGTLSLLTTDSPLHNVKHLETLLDKCEVKNRESAIRALEVTKDLLISHVLPDRRLRWFKDENLTVDADVGIYIVWAYEDWLKQYFFRLLQVMEKLMGDTVENIRVRTLHVVFDFFQKKPEQELNLLRLGVNKLGDPAGKVASRVKKLLMDVLQVHPSMKSVVATAIGEVVGRSSDYRTRYYAIDTLSEFILSQRDSQLPNQLVMIYLHLFKRLLAEWNLNPDIAGEKSAPSVPKGKKKKVLRGKKGGVRQAVKTQSQAEEEQNARLVAKIFTGLNRAFPFSSLDSSVFGEYMDTLYKMSHSPNTATYIEALSFIFQLAKAQGGAGLDRYYRALYESLQDLRLYQSSKVPKYVNLLLRSLAGDAESERSSAFAKRVLQVALSWPDVGSTASLIHVAGFVPGIMSLIRGQLQNTSTEEAKSIEATVETYDIRARDPKFAKASTSKLWELLPLVNHYHPTVTLYAQNLLDERKQKLDLPDIDQFSVSSFLAKWSYKKAREKDNTRGGSIFQPLSGYTDLTLGVRQQAPGSNVPITLQDWVGRDASQVAPDELFYQEYFSKRPQAAKPKAARETSGEGSDSEADEDEVFKAIMRTNPDELGSDLDDAGFSDLSDDADESDEDALKAAFEDSEDADELNSDHGGSEDDAQSGQSGSDDNFDEDLDSDDSNDAAFDDFDEDLQAGASVTNAADTNSKSGQGGVKKRKQDWNSYPTFMDADAFDEAYATKAKEAAEAPAKRIKSVNNARGNKKRRF